MAWVGCQNTQSITTPKPTPQMAEVSGRPYATLKKSPKVYQEKRSQCHGQRLSFTLGLP